MKKIFSVCLLAVTVCILAGCSKISEDDLVGTKWVSEPYGSHIMTIDFVSTSRALISISDEKDGNMSVKYSLDYPDISFKEIDCNDCEMVGKFTDKETFKLKEDPEDDEYLTTLHKQ